MDSKTQGSRPRTKNPRPRPRTALTRTDPLEAKDRNARGQGPVAYAEFSKGGARKFENNEDKRKISPLRISPFSCPKLGEDQKKKSSRKLVRFSAQRTGQGHLRKCSQKKVFKNFFRAISKRRKQKRSSQIFREVSGAFLHNLKNEQIPTIVGTDANAHHAIWGFTDINPQGEDLLAYCVSADLNFCNVGNKPTFSTKTREEVLDLAIVNRCMWDLEVGWLVSNVLSFSDHMYSILGSRLKVESKNRLKCFEMFVTRAGTSM